MTSEFRIPYPMVWGWATVTMLNTQVFEPCGVNLSDLRNLPNRGRSTLVRTHDNGDEEYELFYELSDTKVELRCVVRRSQPYRHAIPLELAISWIEHSDAEDDGEWVKAKFDKLECNGMYEITRRPERAASIMATIRRTVGKAFGLPPQV